MSSKTSQAVQLGGLTVIAILGAAFNFLWWGLTIATTGFGPAWMREQSLDTLILLTGAVVFVVFLMRALREKSASLLSSIILIEVIAFFLNFFV